MEIRTGYIAKWKCYPTDEVKVRVAKPSFLGPSIELLKDWKDGKISWTEYERRYVEEMKNPKAIEKIREIVRIAEAKPIRLMCYEKNPPCHRFILKEIIEDKRGCRK